MLEAHISPITGISMMRTNGTDWQLANVCCIIFSAANRVWERGQSDKWFNYARARMRGVPEPMYVNGKVA